MPNPYYNETNKINLTPRQQYTRSDRVKKQYLIEGCFIGANDSKLNLIYKNFTEPKFEGMSLTMLRKLNFLLDPFSSFELNLHDKSPAYQTQIYSKCREVFLLSEEDVMKSFFTVPLEASKNGISSKNRSQSDKIHEEVLKCTNPTGKLYCSGIIVPDLQLEVNTNVDLYKNTNIGVQEIAEIRRRRQLSLHTSSQPNQIVSTQFMICLVSKFPFFDQHRQFLLTIFQRIKTWRVINFIKHASNVAYPNFFNLIGGNSYENMIRVSFSLLPKLINDQMMKNEILELKKSNSLGLTTDSLITQMLDMKCPYFTQKVVFPQELNSSKIGSTKGQRSVTPQKNTLSFPLIELKLKSKVMSQFESTVSNCSFIYGYLNFTELFFITHYLLLDKSLCFVSSSMHKLSSAM